MREVNIYFILYINIYYIIYFFIILYYTFYTYIYYIYKMVGITTKDPCWCWLTTGSQKWKCSLCCINVYRKRLCYRIITVLLVSFSLSLNFSILLCVCEQQLKQQRDKLKQYQKRITLQLDKERELAKQLLKDGKKEWVWSCLSSCYSQN